MSCSITPNSRFTKGLSESTIRCDQSNVEAIAGELSIFTVPVDLIFLKGKEMHRQARFIDMQSFEKQLYMMQNAID